MSDLLKSDLKYKYDYENGGFWDRVYRLERPEDKAAVHTLAATLAEIEVRVWRALLRAEAIQQGRGVEFEQALSEDKRKRLEKELGIET
jgi:hypothetical protein